MTDTPTGTTNGRADGHPLYRLSERAVVSGPRDQFLVTSVEPEQFMGSPYPAPGLKVHGSGGNPPWLVVNHYLERTLIARWPIRLWRVTDVEAAPPEEQVGSWYTRAISLVILEELPPGLLFGPHGNEVVKVIEAAQGLSESDVATLESGRRGEAGATYHEAWRRWEEEGPPSGSPVGQALTLIHRGVDGAAHRVGPWLFRDDRQDGVEVLCASQWVAAQDALPEAAMGFGAQGLRDEERAVLTEAWAHWVSS